MPEYLNWSMGDFTADPGDPDITAAIERVRNARILFAHQSVGADLLRGIFEWCEALNVPKPIVIESGDIPVDGGFVASVRIGDNRDPLGKCRAFNRLMNGEVGMSCDLALFKLCYVDVDRETDVKALFNYYQAVIGSSDRAAGPSVIPCSLPLRNNPCGGVWLRALAGRTKKAALDNIARNRFNQLVYSAWSREIIADIAGWESTRSDGRRESFGAKGKCHYALVGGFTSDGGHLNAMGRRVVGARFIRHLAMALEAKATTRNY